MGVASSANAALLASESFNYEVGANLANGTQNGGLGFTSGWAVGGASTSVVSAGSLNYPPSVAFTPTGNSGSFTTTNEFFAQLNRGFDAPASLPAASAGTRYVSFLMNTNNLNAYNQLGIGANSSYVTFGFNGNQFRIDASGGASGASVAFGTPVAGTTYLFVGKVVNDGTNSTASLNVYAPGDTVPGTEGAYQATTGSFVSRNLNGLYGFQGQNSAVLYDEFRIGDTYADVVTVPEPTTFALVGLGALGLAARRRRA
jgi:hypothetical protein